MSLLSGMFPRFEGRLKANSTEFEHDHSNKRVLTEDPALTGITDSKMWDARAGLGRCY
jgi:hypothetical protein